MNAPTRIRQRDALDAQTITLKQKAEAASAAVRAANAQGRRPRSISTRRCAISPRCATSCGPIRLERRARGEAARASRSSPPRGNRTPCPRACRATSPASRRAKRAICFRRATRRSPARAVFERKCALDGGLRDELSAIVAKIRAAPPSDRTAAANGFNEAKTVVDACVVAGKAAGLSDDEVRELLKKSDAYLRAHSSERNKFELAREAFWSFTPDSTMAIGVAMAQDAFLFIMKFLSEIFRRGYDARERRQFAAPIDLTDDEDEPVDIRAMKAILRVARPVHGDMSEIDPRVRNARRAAAQCARQSRRHPQPAGARRDRPCRPQGRLRRRQCHGGADRSRGCSRL